MKFNCPFCGFERGVSATRFSNGVFFACCDCGKQPAEGDELSNNARFLIKQLEAGEKITRHESDKLRNELADFYDFLH